MSDIENPAANHPLLHPSRITLPDRIIVRIAGPGTDKFLQGQFSQQIDDVIPAHSPRAAACTPKGRAYCLTRLVRDGEDVLMELPRELADDTLGHLRKYLMLFRGASMEVEPDARIIGLIGASTAEQLLTDATDRLAAAGDSVVIQGGHLIRTMNTGEGVARYELWQTGVLDESIQRALSNIQEATLADWYASEIAAGVAVLTPATKEGFVPQMLNWQHVGGIHFKKGCYTGQEVIARMHFLGQLKKSLFRYSAGRTENPPAPGEAIVNGDRAVGTVINSVVLPDGTAEILAVVRHDAAELSLAPESAPDNSLSLRPLPYSVSEREQTGTSDT
ncbi:CAF17-like 4Fe-4S cluster assembly/insertion protein YgfZ [Marinobacter orientalis]|uniref:Folate-binding protein YgfZ n=1 Tax=Marinobacter orientalis TaxID=1928859 RepID=A0A7Y0WSU1_9GAMM|nr:folate-binding protein YgfZ [Marinobacter orientalis]NMT64152.1 folate-binding protein YgfZ [Marinobacter orientalis]TGX49380.1 folate-binding protein [Marinobacter orientalis]